MEGRDRRDDGRLQLLVLDRRSLPGPRRGPACLQARLQEVGLGHLLGVGVAFLEQRDQPIDLPAVPGGGRGSGVLEEAGGGGGPQDQGRRGDDPEERDQDGRAAPRSPADREGPELAQEIGALGHEGGDRVAEERRGLDLLPRRRARPDRPHDGVRLGQQPIRVPELDECPTTEDVRLDGCVRHRDEAGQDRRRLVGLAGPQRALGELDHGLGEQVELTGGLRTRRQRGERLRVARASLDQLEQDGQRLLGASVLQVDVAEREQRVGLLVGQSAVVAEGGQALEGFRGAEVESGPLHEQIASDARLALPSPGSRPRSAARRAWRHARSPSARTSGSPSAWRSG